MTDTMRIWNAVSKTNPANTKKVTQRGGFTSICAQSQIMEATRQFGPIGEGWGYDAEAPIFHDGLCFVRVALWHGSRDNRFGPVTGGSEWKSNNGRLDSDAPKKATTDALTKLLSQLGFNADVFLGLFDDNKYVQQVTREFAGQPEPQRQAPAPRAAPKPAGEPKTVIDIADEIALELDEIATQFPGKPETFLKLVQTVRQTASDDEYENWKGKNLAAIEAMPDADKDLIQDVARAHRRTLKKAA